MRRSQFAAVWLTLAVLAAGGAAYVVTRPSTAPPARTGTPAPPPRPAALASLRATAIPDPRALAVRLRSGLHAAAFGGSLAALVVDARSGRVLFARHADAPMPPASTVKLLTSVAAIVGLGATATLSTVVRRAGHTLYLVGGGDVTLAGRRAPPGYPSGAALADLAVRTAAALGGSTPPLRLRYDASGWTGPMQAPGWTSGYFTAGDVSRLSPLEVDEGRVRPGGTVRVADPAATAAADFARALRAAGVDLAGAPVAGRAPVTSTAVAQVTSAPVAALVQHLLTTSDNDLAEALGRTLAVHGGRPATFSGAAAAVLAGVAGAGLPTAGLRLFDASGLSHLDRVTVRTLVAVLRVAQRRPALAAVGEGLAVGGFTGTLATRFRRGPAAGVVRAKTGTLNGVSALAGQVVDADGRLLDFAFLTDHAPSPVPAERALDRLAASVAACGCAAAAP